jgi:hypothetical protein
MSRNIIIVLMYHHHKPLDLKRNIPYTCACALAYTCICLYLFIYIFIILSGVRLSPLSTAATTGLPYQPQMIDVDYGAIGGKKIGRGNPSTWRKPALAPLRPPQIPHDQTRARTRAAAVGSQRLTARALCL